jgi:hypothetical protein
MFDVNINCVIFGANQSLNKRGVLSLNKDDIILPKLSLTKDLLTNLNNSIISFLKEYVFVNELELIPQLINIHHPLLGDSSLEVIYGFIIDYNSSINNEKAYWIDFDPLKELKLSPVLFETMQKLS